MPKTAASAVSVQTRNYAVFLIVVYLWIFVAEPQTRFEFLGQIHFERFVMAFGWAALFLTGRQRMRFSGITALVILFYAWMFLSYFFSPYQGYYHSEHWLGNYWKLIVFYFLLFFAINDLKDLTSIFKGFVIVLFLYQLHSWYDFLNGGSYVYQQGVKRIIGVWSGGIGAANAFGMIALVSLPFALFWFNSARKNIEKVFLLFYFLMSVATIMFSGTRAAMVGMFFLFLIHFVFGRHRNLKIIFLFAALLVVLTAVLPEEMRHRYFDLIIVSDKTEVTSRSDEIAIGSAEGRKKGLIDGFKMGLKRPVFGYGPGASPIAKLEISPEFAEEEGGAQMQLHNLYGQIVSETGFGGALIFLSTIAVYFYQLRRLKHTAAVDKEEKAVFEIFIYTFYLGMLVWLFYGFFSHTLYRYPWFLLFGCHGAFIDIASRMNGRWTESLNGLKGRV